MRHASMLLGFDKILIKIRKKIWCFSCGVSPIRCPHVFLTLLNHYKLDFDFYIIIQKDKKSETLVFEWQLSWRLQ